MMGPKNVSTANSVAKVCKNHDVGERKRSAVGVSGGGAGVVRRSDPAKAINILAHGEVISAPLS